MGVSYVSTLLVQHIVCGYFPQNLELCILAITNDVYEIGLPQNAQMMNAAGMRCSITL